MAHQPVAELWIRGQGGQLVRVGTQAPVQAEAGQRELTDVVQRSAISPGALLFGGLAMGVVGGALFLLAPLSLATAIAAGTSVTVGGGLAYLGLIKRRRPPPGEDPKALPGSKTSALVIAERSRRVTVVLNQLGQGTYETILKRLQWTNEALLETLVHMKDEGQVEEDLDLDTGEWIYRANEGEVLGALPAPSLSDRQGARAGTDHT